MSDYPTEDDAKRLRGLVDSAMAVRYDITWDHDYPNYPEQIRELMTYITTSVWCNSQYKPAKTKQIPDHLDQADLEEVRSLLTALSRSERFLTGSWKNALESGRLENVVQRAEQLIRA